MKEHAMDHLLIRGDARHIPLADGSVHCVVTSPPYWGLRDYGEPGQIGLEPMPDEYVCSLVTVFVEVWRVLRDDGVVWLNLGDSYAGGKIGRDDVDRPDSRQLRDGKRGRCPKVAAAAAECRHRPVPDGLKPKDLCLIPARVALALQAWGWYVRAEVIWCKGAAMPEPVIDRPTHAHETVYLLSKRERYWYDADAVREPFKGDGSFDVRAKSFADVPGSKRHKPWIGERPSKMNLPSAGRNLRSWWVINPRPFKGAHFAVMPPALAERCIRAGCPRGGVVFDPFGGAGTTAVAALALGRRAIVAELSARYLKIARRRIARPHAPPERERAAEPLPLFDGVAP
jgi:DNA modification methylase